MKKPATTTTPKPKVKAPVKTKPARRRPNMIPRTPRTLATTQNALAKTSKTTSGSGWVGCRLNPWQAKSSGASNMLPDGSGEHRLVNDFYTYCDINLGTEATDFQIVTLPTLPYTAVFKHITPGALRLSGPFNTNGLPAGNLTGVGMKNLNTITTATTNLIPICGTQASDAAYYEDNPTAPSRNTYLKADKARITSQGWRLQYTGPSSTCSGIVNVTTSPLHVDPAFPKSAGQLAFTGADGVSNTFPLATNPVFVQPIALPSTATAPKDAVTLRPETCPRGLVRHADQTFKFTEMFDTPRLIINSNNYGSNIVSGNATSPISIGYNGGAVGAAATATMGTINFLDPSWEHAIISAAGVSGSFRFEMWTCVEYIPEPTSVAYTFSTVSPASNPQAILNTETAVAQQPLAHGTS